MKRYSYVLILISLLSMVYSSSFSQNKVRYTKYENRSFVGTTFWNDSVKVRIDNFSGHVVSDFKSREVQNQINGLHQICTPKNSISIANTVAYFDTVTKQNAAIKSLLTNIPKQDLLLNEKDKKVVMYDSLNYEQYSFSKGKNDYSVLIFPSTEKTKNLAFIFWIPVDKNQNKVLDSQVNTCLSGLKFGKRYTYPAPIDGFTLAYYTFCSGEDSANYIGAVSILRQHDTDYETYNDRDFYSQAINTHASWLGIPYQCYLKGKHQFVPIRCLKTCGDEAQESFSNRTKRLKSIPHTTDSEAYNQLVSECSKNQVVMFNEAHLHPKCRYFVSTFLDTLYRMGFRVLAMEAVGVDADSTEMIYPNQKMGFYTREPQMANLIRNAKKIGFRVIGYDYDGDTWEAREKGQANNLINKTLKLNPNEKMVVLGGHGHIDKRAEEKMFAYYFKEMTHINPLTINQDTYINLNLSKNKIELFKGSYIGDIGCDWYIINQYQREDFKIFPNEKEQTISVKLEYSDAVKNRNEIAAFVYKTEEMKYKEKIPVYTQMLSSKDKTLQLHLPQYNYTLVVKNDLGQVLMQKEVSKEK